MRLPILDFHIFIFYIIYTNISTGKDLIFHVKVQYGIGRIKSNPGCSNSTLYGVNSYPGLLFMRLIR